MLFKVLDKHGCSFSGGRYTWSLPNGKTPGNWTDPVTTPLVMCNNGYHLAKDHGVIDWIPYNSGSNERMYRIFEADYNANRKCISSNDMKLCVRQARLLRELVITDEIENKIINHIVAYICSLEPFRYKYIDAKQEAIELLNNSHGIKRVSFHKTPLPIDNSTDFEYRLARFVHNGFQAIRQLLSSLEYASYKFGVNGSAYKYAGQSCAFISLIHYSGLRRTNPDTYAYLEYFETLGITTI